MVALLKTSYVNWSDEWKVHLGDRQSREILDPMKLVYLKYAAVEVCLASPIGFCKIIARAIEIVILIIVLLKVSTELCRAKSKVYLFHVICNLTAFE